MDSSLSIGVSGLQANQQMLDVVGNNLANLNTTGFKSQLVNFSDLVYQTLRPAAVSASGSATNPMQIGQGVATSLSTDQSQGTLTSTGNPLDLALQGNGAFVVNNGTQNLYTRDGSFSVNQNNLLVDSNGNLVQRYGTVGEASATSPAFQTAGDNDISIPNGTGIPGKETSTVDLTGNLSASDTGPLADTMTSSQPYTAGGAAATGATLLNNLDGRQAAYKTGDSILISGTDADGTTVNTSLAVTAASTMNDLVTAINSAYKGATASIDANGNLVLKDNSTGPTPLTLTLADAASNAGSSGFSNHTMTTTVTGKDGDTVNTSIQVFDTQGTAHTLSVTLQKQSDNSWTLTGALNPADGKMINATVTGIQFNDDGSFRQMGNGQGSLSFQIAGLAAPQTVSLSLGNTNGFGGLTEFGGATSAAATGQDGYAAGFLSSLSVGQDGTVNGTFTNGQTIAVAQIATATFANPAGLNREGQNYFSSTAASGDPQIGAAESGGRGSITGGSLESSNVDVSAEFTQLIVAQQGYQVNARTITVSSEVLQELTNLIH